MNVRKTFLMMLLFLIALPCVYGKEKIQYPAVPIHYDIDAQLEPAENKIAVSAELTLKVVRESFSEVILGYEKNFSLSSVRDSDGAKLKFKEKTGKNYNIIRVAFPHGTMLKKDDQFKLTFQYSGKIDKYISNVNIITEKLTELGQAAVWFPRELDYSSKYSYSYKITAPEDQTIMVSNHHLKLKDKKPVGKNVQWTFSSTGEKSWTLILVASNNLKRFKRTKNNITGSILYVESTEKEIETLFENVISILDTLNEAYGRYSPEQTFSYFLSPREGWSYVRGELVFMPEKQIVGALQPNGVLEKGTYQYLAHEFAHLWWGKAVKAVSEEKHPNADWISEGFAEFSGYLAVEKKMGKEILYETFANINKNFIELQGKLPVSEATRKKFKKWNDWRLLTYYKSAYMVHMLRNLIGDQPFFDQLKIIIRENMGKEVNTTKLLAYFQNKYGSQVDTFIRQFILGSDCPDYRITYSVSGKGKKTRVKGMVTQQTGVFKIPLELKFVAQGKAKTVTVLVDKKQVPFTVELGFEPQDVAVDPEYKVIKKVDVGRVTTSQ
jgi:aminopeptidase N